MKDILNRPEYGLIWRPHPLLFTMLETRFPDCLAYARDLEKRILWGAKRYQLFRWISIRLIDLLDKLGLYDDFICVYL